MCFVLHSPDYIVVILEGNSFQNRFAKVEPLNRVLKFFLCGEGLAIPYLVWIDLARSGDAEQLSLVPHPHFCNFVKHIGCAGSLNW